MKKAIAVLAGAAVISAAIYTLSDAAVASVPSACVTSPKTVSYSKTLNGSGTLSYIGQADMTSPMPLIIKQYHVREGDTVTAGDIIATVDKEGSRSMVESLGQLSSLAVAASSLSTAVSLIPEVITSEYSGTVLSTAGNGAAVEAGSSICTVAATDDLVLTVPVSEEYIAAVELGQAVSFTLTAYPDEAFTGTVADIASAARNKYSGSVLETVVDVTIAPDKYDPRLRSGLTAAVSFTLTQPKNICVLSYDAIGQDESGEYIYVYENGKAVRRKVFTGAEFPDGAEIIKGVSEGELVFTSPDTIRESSYIRLE